MTPRRRPPWFTVAVRVATAWLLCGLSSLWLGPLLVPLEQALADTRHVCACGMAPGTCGCPDCARIERERLLTGLTDASPSARSQCDHDGDLLGGHAGHPVLPPLAPAVPQAALTAYVTPSLPAPFRSTLDPEPPTPPPRPSLAST